MRFKSGEFGAINWFFSMKPGQLTIEPILHETNTIRRLAERWIQLAADAFRLRLILEAGDQRNMQHPFSPIHEQTQSTFATKTPADTVTCEANLSLSTVKRSGLTVRCSYAGTLIFSVWVLVVDTMNTDCEVISSVFENNYLRFDLVKSFFLLFVALNVFERSKNRGWSH